MNLTDLNNKLSSINKVVDLDNIKNTIKSAADFSAAINISDFSSILPGESINGIKSLSDTIEVKNTISNFPLPQIVTLTAEMPGLRDKMVKELTDAEKEILGQMGGPVFTNPVTGATVTPKTLNAELINGVKKANILSSAPASIQSNINNITGGLPDFNNIMKDIIPLDLKGVAKEALSKVANVESLAKQFDVNLTKDLINKVDLPLQLEQVASGGVGGLASAFNGDIKNIIKKADTALGAAIKIDNISGLGLLQDTKLSVLNHIEETVNNVAGKILNPLEKINVITNIKLQNYNGAINQIQRIASKKSKLTNIADATQDVLGISQSALQDIIQLQTTDISSNLVRDDVASSNQTSTSYISQIGKHAAAWGGKSTTISTSRAANQADGDYAFSRVITLEELVAEFNSVKREITEIVVHWTEHFLDQPHAGAREVHEIANNLNLDGCNYHYIIKKNGNLERGRPVEIEGQHTDGHDKFSIAIAFIGGMNCYSTQDPTTFEYGPESLTPIQYETFNYILTAFYKIWPGGQAFGHSEIDPDVFQDPGFSVEDYVKNKFSKINCIIPSDGSKSPDDLVSAPPVIQGDDGYNDIEIDEYQKAAFPPPNVNKKDQPPAPPIAKALDAANGYDHIPLYGNPIDAFSSMKNDAANQILSEIEQQKIEEVEDALDNSGKIKSNTSLTSIVLSAEEQAELDTYLSTGIILSDNQTAVLENASSFTFDDLTQDDTIEQIRRSSPLATVRKIANTDVFSLDDEPTISPIDDLLDHITENNPVPSGGGFIKAKYFQDASTGEVFHSSVNKQAAINFKNLDGLDIKTAMLKATHLLRFNVNTEKWEKYTK